MNNPTEQADILNHVLENILANYPGSPLSFALLQHGCQSILDVMALSPWEIETLQWTDGSKPKMTLPRGPRTNVLSLQGFVLSLHPIPNTMTAKDWVALNKHQYDDFRMSSPWILLRQNAARPTPPPDITKDGEQYSCHWGDLDVLESFDVDKFEAAMLHSAEVPPCCLKKDTTTTTDDPFIEALEDAIVFFETFWLTDDFSAHSMADETHVLGTTVETVPIVVTMPGAVATNKKDPVYSPHALVMKNTMVHIEYPDRTKFVSSMNHEKYEEELKTYSELDGGASVSVKICPIGTTLNDCVMCVPIRDVGE